MFNSLCKTGKPHSNNLAHKRKDSFSHGFGWIYQRKCLQSMVIEILVAKNYCRQRPENATLGKKMRKGQPDKYPLTKRNKFDKFTDENKNSTRFFPPNFEPFVLRWEKASESLAICDSSFFIFTLC